MPYIHLFYGECDGARERLTWTERPEVHFAVPIAEYEFIKAIKDNMARMAAVESRRRLAYKFFRCVSTADSLEFQYTRCAELDKPPVIPAATEGNG
jgi:hypothetical protein